MTDDDIAIDTIPGKQGEVVRALLTVGDTTLWYDRIGNANVGSVSSDSDINLTHTVPISRLSYHGNNNEFRVNVSPPAVAGDIFGPGEIGENASLHIATPYGTIDTSGPDSFKNLRVSFVLTQAQWDLLGDVQVDDIVNIVISRIYIPVTFGSISIPDQRYTKDIAITALQLPSAIDGNKPFSYSVSGLPSGLFLNASRQLVGTPTELGDFTVTFTVEDDDDDTDTLTFDISVEPPPPSVATNILIEIAIDDNTTLRGGTARMRLDDGVTYYDFQVQGISSLKQSVGNIENPRIVPENASITLHKRALAGYDLTGKAIKIINQKSLEASDKVVLFDGFVRSPDGVRETQDQIMIDIESKFSRVNSLITLEKYNASAGTGYNGKFIPAIFGNFTGQPARLHDSIRHAYIVSSYPMQSSQDCPVAVYGDGTEIGASNYSVDYTNAQIVFNASRSETNITVDGCGVRYGHAQIAKWLLQEIIGLADSEIDADSFDDARLVPISQVVTQTNTDAFALLSTLLFESLHEITFVDNQAVLHSRFADSSATIPDSAIIQDGNGREMWEETPNTGRLYANHVFTEVDGDLYEYNDLPEQARVGITSRNLALQWYNFNTDDITDRLRALPNNFADRASAIVRATFDRRALVATAGSVITVKGGTYYILSRNISYSGRVRIQCEMWKRPNKALSGFVSKITQDASAPKDVTIEYDSPAGTAFDLEFFDANDNAIQMIGGLVATSLDETMADNDVYGVAVSLADADIFGMIQGFATYAAEVVTATDRPNAVRLNFNIGGDSTGDRTWAEEGQKIRVEYKEDAQTWDEALTRDFEGIATKAWQVDVDGLISGEDYNFRVFRVWDETYFGITSAEVDGTPTSSTLATPVPTITQQIATLTCRWGDIANAEEYDVEVDTGSGSYVASTDVESPITVTTDAVVDDTYRVRVRARAFGYTTSAWGETSYLVSSIALDAPANRRLRAATQSQVDTITRVVETDETDDFWNEFDPDSDDYVDYYWYISWNSEAGADGYDLRFRVRWSHDTEDFVRTAAYTSVLSITVPSALLKLTKPFDEFTFDSLTAHVRSTSTDSDVEDSSEGLVAAHFLGFTPE